MCVLIGTTNPAKVGWYRRLLEGYDIEFLTLKDLDITTEPTETGKTPEENARIKAEYYGRFFDCVVCGDSGLYFSGLDLYDLRQPGLNIRTPQGIRLDDEEMIEYYSQLVHSLGGRVTAYYLNGTAVCRNGQIVSYMEADKPVGAFYMVEHASEKRHAGWPLDSLSVRMRSMKYFTEEESDAKMVGEENEVAAANGRLSEFLIKALGL